MSEWIRIFFGFASDPREAEGFFSPAHLIFVSAMQLLTALLAILIAKKHRNTEREKQLKPLKVAAIVMLSCETLKAIILCTRGRGIVELRGILPLFLCSVMLFALPLSAFAKGRVREAALDFSLCFGPLCSLAGTYLAGNIFAAPILSFDVLVSTVTHCISGFAGIYIGATRLAAMERKNRPITGLILLVFELLALAVDILQLETPYQSNYMFFMTPDGTPFAILEKAAGGTGAGYTLLVMLTYFAYLILFELIYALFKRRKRGKEQHVCLS